MVEPAYSKLYGVLPLYTYRRFAAAFAYNLLRGRSRLRARLNATNFGHYKRYGHRMLACNVCGHEGRPFFDFPDLHLRREHRIGELRETLQCTRCGATMRHRVLVHGLLQRLSRAAGRQLFTVRDAAQADWHGLRVLDTDAFSPSAGYLRAQPGYVRSSYVGSKPMGSQLAPNHFNIDLQSINFDTASFDVVLTSDVMEHVRDIDQAHAEIARILKPGGEYIFTVPYDAACASHHVLVDTSGADDRYLVEPQFHGDPLTGGILAYRVFGRGIFDDLQRVGFKPAFLEIDDTAALIVAGDLFIATRQGPTNA